MSGQMIETAERPIIASNAYVLETNGIGHVIAHTLQTNLRPVESEENFNMTCFVAVFIGVFLFG